MHRLLALLAVVSLGCATRSAPPARVANAKPVPGAPAPATTDGLVPLNWSGDMSKQVSVPGGVITIALAQSGGAAKVVRIDGTRRTDIFAIPREIDGIPSSLTKFDYLVDPYANVEGETPGQITVIASASEPTKFTYHAVWVLTWNAARGAFDVGAPRIDKQDRSICLPCMSDAS